MRARVIDRTAVLAQTAWLPRVPRGLGVGWRGCCRGPGVVKGVHLGYDSTHSMLKLRGSTDLRTTKHPCLSSAAERFVPLINVALSTVLFPASDVFQKIGPENLEPLQREINELRGQMAQIINQQQQQQQQSGAADASAANQQSSIPATPPATPGRSKAGGLQPDPRYDRPVFMELSGPL